MKQVFIHPFAGVLSAYGIGLADVRVLRERAVEVKLDEELVAELEQLLEELAREGKEEIATADARRLTQMEVLRKVHLRYEGTDTALIVDFGNVAAMKQQFEAAHRQQYGFIAENKGLIVEAVSVEVVEKTYNPEEPVIERKTDAKPEPVATVQMYAADTWQETPVFKREDLQPGDCISGPALIIEATGTNVIEPSWQAELTARNHLILKRTEKVDNSIRVQPRASAVKADPILLEIFNNLFRSIAEQMGITLQNTSSSVNIKERLDFSCAIFDQQGQLVANAPHIPVHLGSMSESVGSLIEAHGDIPQTWRCLRPQQPLQRRHTPP
jgi:5-oxoprolinase (ATP-hydrolysing)